MRLEVSRKSDLALRALSALHAETGRMKGPALAREVGSSAGFMSQVLGPLVRDGIVRSDPGRSGGYSLGVDLTTLSVLRVIEAIEGPTDSGRCVLVGRPCTESGPCALHMPWTRALGLLIGELDATTVADLAPARIQLRHRHTP